MWSRRRALKALAATPAISQLAAKETAESMFGRPITKGIDSGFVEGQPTGIGGSSHILEGSMTARAMLRVPWARAEILRLFQQTERVYCIDPDIMIHRSFSLAAKIFYQRQRNAELRLKELEEGTYWSVKDNLFNDLAKRLLLK